MIVGSHRACQKRVSTQNFRPVPRAHVASRKGLLDGARDLPSFSIGMVDPAQSSQDVPINLTLPLTRRESSSVIKGGTCRCLPDSPECTAVRADMKGNRLNSRFQYIHENESVRAHGGHIRRIGWYSG